MGRYCLAVHFLLMAMQEGAVLLGKQRSMILRFIRQYCDRLLQRYTDYRAGFLTRSAFFT